MPSAPPAALVWLRRDLRCDDHSALYHALRRFPRVYCAFVFDTDILDALPTRCDRRVEFIHASVLELHQRLQQLAWEHGVPGGGLIVRHGPAVPCIVQLAQELGVQEVLTNRDYEPAAIARDQQAAQALHAAGIAFSDYKDQVLLEKNEVLTQQGQPYSVFTPYKRAWLQKLDAFQRTPYPVQRYAQHLAALPSPSTPLPTLEALGFTPTNLPTLALPTGMSGAQQLLQDFLPRLHAYHEARDFPGRKGVSYLSVHLRFGTISIRQLAALAAQQAATGCQGAQTWLAELAWRDFYFMILYHHPQVVTHAFKPEYDAIAWVQGDSAQLLFQAWCDGRTGYPLVDAAMAQINQTGYMHNRLRMVTASFLVKDLGIDWRWGERYFAEKLNDFDLASNNGGWQWAASSGCDAQPYFRIFNPVSQSEKFDPQGKFIRKYLPVLEKLSGTALHSPWLASPIELAAADVTLGQNYPRPVVQHAEARALTLQRYAVVKKS